MAAIDPARGLLPLSSRSHLHALRRSVALAVIGVAVGIALAWSSSPSAGAGGAPTAIGEPRWTYHGGAVIHPTSCVGPGVRSID